MGPEANKATQFKRVDLNRSPVQLQAERRPHKSDGGSALATGLLNIERTHSPTGAYSSAESQSGLNRHLPILGLRLASNPSTLPPKNDLFACSEYGPALGHLYLRFIDHASVILLETRNGGCPAAVRAPSSSSFLFFYSFSVPVDHDSLLRADVPFQAQLPSKPVNAVPDSRLTPLLFSLCVWATPDYD